MFRVRWAAFAATLAVALVAGTAVGSSGADEWRDGPRPASPLESSVGHAQPLAALVFDTAAGLEQRAQRPAKASPFALAPIIFTVLVAVGLSSLAWRRGARGEPAARTRRHSIVLRAPPFLASA